MIERIPAGFYIIFIMVILVLVFLHIILFTVVSSILCRFSFFLFLVNSLALPPSPQAVNLMLVILVNNYYCLILPGIFAIILLCIFLYFITKMFVTLCVSQFVEFSVCPIYVNLQQQQLSKNYVML